HAAIAPARAVAAMGRGGRREIHRGGAATWRLVSAPARADERRREALLILVGTSATPGSKGAGRGGARRPPQAAAVRSPPKDARWGRKEEEEADMWSPKVSEWRVERQQGHFDPYK